jgi:uncharacterized protein
MSEFGISGGKEKRAVSLSEKLQSLREILSGLRSVLIAFSGGVDSTLLLKVASEELKERIVAVTADSETLPRAELSDAKAIASSLGVRHVIIRTNEMCDPDFVSNPPDRCFHCKKVLFHRLSELARQFDLEHLIEGSNYSDLTDYRPGMKAVRQFDVRSPLMEAGLTKADIRVLSKEFGLPTWDKPASPCLASRIPYGSEITRDKLNRIEQAEQYLHSLGFKTLRIRDHGTIARIEVPEGAIHMLFRGNKPAEISVRFRQLGYRYVAVDLQGYRTGSMNESLQKDEHG